MLNTDGGPCGSVEQACSEMVDMLFSEHRPDKRWRQDKLPRGAFRGLLPMHPRWMEHLVATNQGGFLVNGADAFDRVPESAYITTIDGSDEASTAAFVSVRHLGRIPRHAHQVPCDEAWSVSVRGIYEDDRSFTATDFFARAGRHLFNVTKYAGVGPHRPSSEQVKTWRSGGGLALTLRYEWQVYLGLESSDASFSMVADRHALSEVFRLRDIPNGKSRRAALKHFVSSHWRTRGVSAIDLPSQSFVKEHMRGQTVFAWNGLRCEIRPPVYDVERLRGAMPRTDSAAHP
jgi:hypothetical protein